MRVLFWGKEFQRFFDTLSTVFAHHEMSIADPLDDKGALNDAEVLVIRPATVDDELLARAPSLRLVQQWGAGTEGIDVAACSKRGVIACNVPSLGTGNAEGVAEVAFLHMLLHAKRFFRAREKLMEGKVYTPPGTALWGKRGCVVGLGNVGRSVALRMKAFGMAVTGVNRTSPSEVGVVDDFFPLFALEQAVKGCRFVVAALSLNTATENIFSESFFNAMDRDAFFINVARGGLVRRDALEKALKEKWIAGAGLDVLWEEPHSPADPILTQPAVTVTPHIGGVNDASFEGVLSFIVRNIDLLASGNSPLSRLDIDGAGASSSR
ncbi:MAG: glyoxylate reductase [Verrucomicrobiae bacterium]|nr:glyoxylate reductase [Verrucomicrobiae bacterium]